MQRKRWSEKNNYFFIKVFFVVYYFFPPFSVDLLSPKHRLMDCAQPESNKHTQIK